MSQQICGVFDKNMSQIVGVFSNVFVVKVAVTMIMSHRRSCVLNNQTFDFVEMWGSERRRAGYNYE